MRRKVRYNVTNTVEDYVMNEQYTCQQIVDGINGGAIRKVSFSVKGYGHYSNCVIERLPSDSPDVVVIEVRLTPDGTETATFFRRFNPDEKLFALKGIRYSLKQIWKHIEIKSVQFV